VGYRPEVIEAQLAHVEVDRVRTAYNDAKYLVERRELMQTRVDDLETVTQGGQVTPFHKGRPAWADEFTGSVRLRSAAHR
jgi:hypothetical protein